MTNEEAIEALLSILDQLEGLLDGANSQEITEKIKGISERVGLLITKLEEDINDSHRSP